MVHANAQHTRGGDRPPLIEQKREPLAAPDQPDFEPAFRIHRAVEVRRHRLGAILRMTRDANGVPAEALDPVMPALGLHINQGARRQIAARYEFGGCRIYFLPLEDAIASPLVAAIL